MGAGFPLEMLLTVKFAKQEGKTTLTVGHGGIPAAEIDSGNAGWTDLHTRNL
jgi:hypothetical protein